MFIIGEFASIGRVSVRMLRHYDDIGVLAPAKVDPYTGYRSYAGAQLAELARILMFKDLGIRLETIKLIMHGTVDDGKLHALLADRRSELARDLELDSVRLKRLDAHLRNLEGETVMSTVTTEIKGLAPLRLAQTSSTAPGFGHENIGPVIGPMFGRLHDCLTEARATPGPHTVARYKALDEGEGAEVQVLAAFIVGDDVASGPGYEVVVLPAVEVAITTMHYGSMATIKQAWEELLIWIRENGYEPNDVCRELYLVSEPEPQENWVTELQQPARKR